MIKITKSQREALEKAGLIRYRKVKNGIEVQAPNIYVANREHLSRSKCYYVVEEAKIMKFLGLWTDSPKKNNFYNNKNKNFNHDKKREIVKNDR